MQVKYLPVSLIEEGSLRLLAEYGRRFGEVIVPPVPVEELLESHLELQLSFDDLSKRLGQTDVLGASWIADRAVVIDESLDPTVHPHREGRYRFTVAHEIGHWRLHRALLEADRAQPLLFGDAERKPSIVCRGQSRKERIEWQADTFAGFLLMPEIMVRTVWRDVCGCDHPYVAEDEIYDLTVRWGLAENEQPTVAVSREMARRFNVSGQAMQIRLLGLGLIKTEAAPPDMFSCERQ